ncbi:dolichol-phosphate mannosyltransferase [Xylaria flabelliformis]|nr:dolichol-phosphate mannosyltransferase [Xylaria flabelliformis]
MSPNTFTATVHPFPSPTSNACAYEIGLQNGKDALIFIGGLGDGPHTVPYPRAIAKRLEKDASLSYSVFEFRLKSSFSAFGFARLIDDVADIAALVKYLRSIGKQRIVLMGHSTGCQDCLEFAAPAHNAPPVDGYILQGPVCDRDAMALGIGYAQLEESIAAAKQLIDAGRAHERMPATLLPNFMQDTPISAWRWYALVATDGEDNYFSPELTDDKAASYWTRIDKPLLILHSGNDEHVPNSLDKETLVKHWRGLCKPGIASELSGIIPGANHRVEEPDAEEWLCNTVTEFLRGIK